MSADSVWDQKHAATSSIQSSDLLGGFNPHEVWVSGFYHKAEYGFIHFDESPKQKPIDKATKKAMLKIIQKGY